MSKVTEMAMKNMDSQNSSLKEIIKNTKEDEAEKKRAEAKKAEAKKPSPASKDAKKSSSATSAAASQGSTNESISKSSTHTEEKSLQHAEVFVSTLSAVQGVRCKKDLGMVSAVASMHDGKASLTEFEESRTAALTKLREKA